MNKSKLLISIIGGISAIIGAAYLIKKIFKNDNSKY